MRKFLRILLWLVVLIIVIVVVAGLIAPKETNLSVSNTINAPKEQVWEQIVKFKNWPHWSPWYRMDTAAKIDYAGTDGEPGSSYHWTGEKMGEGTMTNKSVENGQMNYELAFVKPFEGNADGYLKVEDTAGMTKVTWTFHSVDDKFLMRGIGYVMSMFHSLEDDFRDGLQNMKEYCESHKMEVPAAAAVNIQEIQFPGKSYTGYRAVVSFQNFDKAFGEAMGKLGPRINGAAVSIFYNWDPQKQEADVFMGAPISAGEPIKGATVVDVPPSRAYMVAHVGDPSGTETSHKAISEHMAAKNEKETLKMEEFPNPDVKDMNQWVTNIYYMVK